MSYAEQPEFRACEVHGTEGTVLWQQHRGGVELFTTASDMWTFIGEGDDYDANQMFLDEMEHFLACIDGKQEPLIDLQQARRVLELALEARQPWDARREGKVQ
jgi:predicted dehydrogenase